MLNLHDPGRLSAKDFYEQYAMPLQRNFIRISQHGIRIDRGKHTEYRKQVTDKLGKHCDEIAALLGKKVVAAQPEDTKPDPNVLNLSSNAQIIKQLKSLGLKPPKKRRSDGQYTESVDEESLNELYAQTGHSFLKALSRIRELNKLLGTYIDVELEGDTLYGSYFVTGTVTGRRSCRENFLGLGSNLQNQPKHSDLASGYRACLVARPGKIFVKCDQVSAEDWIVQGIIADQSHNQLRQGLDELLSGTVDRHAKLASIIFSKPIEKCGKDTPERYMGKRVRHAGNYDMEAFRFSQIMAGEGYAVNEKFCAWILEKFHTIDPGIRQVFHKHIQNEMITKRQLTTPFGFTRQFFGLRDYGDNRKLFKEGYAQVPQGTVGQNTGMAILWLERNHPGHVVLDEHDAVTLEVPDDHSSVWQAVQWLQEAFDRIIRLQNGLEFIIPIEIELGYNLRDMKTVKCADLNLAGLTSIYNGLAKPVSHQNPGTCGPPPRLSPEPSNATSG